MIVSFHDIHQDQDLEDELEEERILGAVFDEILYADDTMLLANNTKNYLKNIENCKNTRVTRQTFPEKGEVLTFKKVESLHHHPMLI